MGKFKCNSIQTLFNLSLNTSSLHEIEKLSLMSLTLKHKMKKNKRKIKRKGIETSLVSTFEGICDHWEKSCAIHYKGSYLEIIEVHALIGLYLKTPKAKEKLKVKVKS